MSRVGPGCVSDGSGSRARGGGGTGRGDVAVREFTILPTDHQVPGNRLEEYRTFWHMFALPRLIFAAPFCRTEWAY